MGEFKPLTEEEIWKLLEGHKDILTPLAKKEEAFLRASFCPLCKATAPVPFVDPLRPFVSGNPLPNKLLRCITCEAEFSPYTGLITKAPTPA